jgi:hypothetical protein
MINDPYVTPQPGVQPRRVPNSEIEYNLRLTDPVYGTTEVNTHIKEKLEKYFYVRDKDNNLVYEPVYDDNGNPSLDAEGKPILKPLLDRKSMWERLNFYTRDMRLGNLDRAEKEYCQWWLDMANDSLQEDFFESFVICLSRSATVLELSQSKGGFLRKQPNTLTTENKYMEMEPAKKSLLGKKER